MNRSISYTGASTLVSLSGYCKTICHFVSALGFHPLNVVLLGVLPGFGTAEPEPPSSEPPPCAKPTPSPTPSAMATRRKVSATAVMIFRRRDQRCHHLLWRTASSGRGF